MRTWLTILGVGVGIAATFFLVSLGYGLQTLLFNQITTSESLLSLDVYPPDSNIVPLNDALLRTIEEMPSVNEVSPVANLPAQITLNGFTGDTLAQIVTPSFFKLDGLKTQYGSFFTASDTKQVVVSSTVLKLLNIEPAEIIGKSLDITFFLPPVPAADHSVSTPGQAEVNVQQQRTLTVVGVIQDDLSSQIYLSYDSLPEFRPSVYTQAKVRVASTDVLDDVRQKIKENGLTVVALSDTIAEATKIFKAIQIILALFGIVALVVAAIGMFNTVTIALLERTQEIGIMRSIGAARADMMVMFLTESALMGFFGGVTGLIMGYVGGEVFNWLLNILATRLGSPPLQLFVRPLWFILTIAVSSAFIGLCTGILPARRAAKLNTLEALRYK
jgi:putative ABC transport system permease protein